MTIYYAVRDMTRSDYHLIGVFFDRTGAQNCADEKNMYGRSLEVIEVRKDTRPAVS